VYPFSVTVGLGLLAIALVLFAGTENVLEASCAFLTGTPREDIKSFLSNNCCFLESKACDAIDSTDVLN
jgi:hypothetical protein